MNIECRSRTVLHSGSTGFLPERNPPQARSAHRDKEVSDRRPKPVEPSHQQYGSRCPATAVSMTISLDSTITTTADARPPMAGCGVDRPEPGGPELGRFGIGGPTRVVRPIVLRSDHRNPAFQKLMPHT